MTNTSTYNVRINTSIRDQAEELFRSMGLSLPAAINLFLTQAVAQARLPLTEIVPSPKYNLIRAMEETNAIGAQKGRQTFDNGHDLIADIHAEECEDV